MAATSANLILQTQVPFAVILGWLIGGEHLDLRKSIGTAIALAGVAIVIGLPEVPPPLVPTLLVIAGAFTWALGQVLARRLGQDCGFGLLKLNAYGSVPQLALATLLFESRTDRVFAERHLAGMVDAAFRRGGGILSRLSLLVRGAAPVPHGRGGALHPADAGGRHRHRLRAAG